jgi:membrane protein YqaA with SNARE-associated domain
MKQCLYYLRIWTLKTANTKQGALTLFILAFADASFLPLPITSIFIVLALFNTDKAYKYALFNTLGTLAGALAGYATGHLAWINVNGEFTVLAQFLFNHIPGFSLDFFNKLDLLFSKWGFWILSLSALTPIPYGIFSITAGVFNINLFLFFFCTVISQGIKFYLLAFLTIKFGPLFKKLAEFKWQPAAIITTAGIIIVIVIINAFRII